MALIGLIEKKNGDMATILIKKVLPCGDKCKNCNAGCKLYSIHIQTMVNNSLKEGDYVKVLQKDDANMNNSVVQYAIPALLLIGSIIIVNLLPQIHNKGMATLLAVLASTAATQVLLKLYDKMQMKKNAVHFIIGEKCNE
jgi:positive regulator of sigma E activity